MQCKHLVRFKIGPSLKPSCHKTHPIYICIAVNLYPMVAKKESPYTCKMCPGDDGICVFHVNISVNQYMYIISEFSGFRGA